LSATRKLPTDSLLGAEKAEDRVFRGVSGVAIAFVIIVIYIVIVVVGLIGVAWQTLWWTESNDELSGSDSEAY
jgi:flagellar basal body-associated protein FliL